MFNTNLYELFGYAQNVLQHAMCFYLWPCQYLYGVYCHIIYVVQRRVNLVVARFVDTVHRYHCSFSRYCDSIIHQVLYTPISDAYTSIVLLLIESIHFMYFVFFSCLSWFLFLCFWPIFTVYTGSCAIICAINVSFWTTIDPYFLLFKSWFLHWFLDVKVNKRKQHFKKFNFNIAYKSQTPSGHNHPKSGCLRDEASKSIDRFIKTSKLSVYSVSMSTTDQKNGHDGYRLYYTPRDAVLPPQFDSITTKHVLKFVDVDYYVDLSYWASHCSDMLLFTFMPNAPAGSTMEGAYRSLHGGFIDVGVPMGTRYRHRLFEHDNDFVKFSYGLIDYYFFVEGRAIGDTGYCIIYYVFAYKRVRFILNAFLGDAPTVKPRNDTNGSFAIRHYLNVNGVPTTSFSQLGSYHAVTVPTAKLEAVFLRFKQYAGANNITIVECLSGDGFNKVTDTPVVMELIRRAISIPDLKYPPIRSVEYRCTVDVNELSVEPKPVARLGHHALEDGGAVPANERATEVNAAVERVINLQAAGEPPLCKDELDLMLEFIALILPSQSLEPFSTEQVLECQSRPTQMLEYERSLPHIELQAALANSFYKIESYAAVNASRMITQFNAAHRHKLSRYTLALANHLKKFDWYAFGLSPLQIAQRVHKVARKYPFLIETDYSRFDGRHGPKFYEFEVLLTKMAFGDEVADLVRSEVNLQVRTRKGFKYSTGFSRCSGSPVTSVFNTVCNALICYIALRRSGMCKAKSFAGLGVYGGDDGLTYVPKPELLREVAVSFGAKLKLSIRPRGKFVGFLGRLFVKPDICDASIYDLRRFITRAHITVVGNSTTLDVAMARKAFGYMVTDAQTPIIKEWYNFIVMKFGRADTPEITQYFARLSVDDVDSRFPQLGYDDPIVQAVVAKLIPNHETIIKRILGGMVIEPEEVEPPEMPFPYVVRGRVVSSSSTSLINSKNCNGDDKRSKRSSRGKPRGTQSTEQKGKATPGPSLVSAGNPSGESAGASGQTTAPPG